jgi:hypothetical protein
MSSDTDNDQRRRSRAAQVATQTGVTEAEVLSLIDMLGMDTGALVREAHILKQSKK